MGEWLELMREVDGRWELDLDTNNELILANLFKEAHAALLSRPREHNMEDVAHMAMQHAIAAKNQLAAQLGRMRKLR